MVSGIRGTHWREGKGKKAREQQKRGGRDAGRGWGEEGGRDGRREGAKRREVHQAPLSTGFSRQEYWSGLPCPPPADLSDPGIDSASPELADGFFTTEPPGKPRIDGQRTYYDHFIAASQYLTLDRQQLWKGREGSRKEGDKQA